MKSKVAGRVTHLYVKEGSRVTGNQPVADIDPIEINFQVDQIKAQLDSAKARQVQSQRGVLYQKEQTADVIQAA